MSEMTIIPDLYLHGDSKQNYHVPRGEYGMRQISITRTEEEI